MSNTDTYKNHWQDKKHLDAFIAFKNFTLRSEEDFAVKCAHLLSGKTPNKPLTLLDIGVGNGLVTNYFLAEFVKHKQVKKYTGIDVSPDLIQQASKKLEGLKSQVNIELLNADAITFKPDAEQDLIYAFNSWYGIPFQKVRDFRRSLSSEGALAILLNSELNLTIDVTGKFKPEENVTSSEQLMGWLKENGVPYEAHLITTEFTSRNDFLNSDGIRKEATGFFEYLLRGDVSRLDEIGEYVKDKPDEYFNLPQYLVVIRSNKQA